MTLSDPGADVFAFYRGFGIAVRIEDETENGINHQFSSGKIDAVACAIALTVLAFVLIW